MRGRALSWEIFPFSFREFLDSGDRLGDPVDQATTPVQKAFGEYWETGGFPEVAGLPEAPCSRRTRSTSTP